MKRVSTLVGGMVLGFVLGMVLVFIVGRFQSPPKVSNMLGNSQTRSQLQIDAPAPDFKLENLNGELVKIKNFHGRFVLINFWATWCGPCRLEMPVFQSRVDAHPDDFVVVTVNSQDPPGDVQAFMDELGLNIYALLDPDGEVHKQYMVRGFPTSYLVDRSGVLKIQHVGLMSEDQLDRYLIEMGIRE